MKTMHVILVALLTFVLAGCANFPPRADLVGQSRAEVLARLGAPEREYSAQGLQKLHYPGGFAGSHTYFVYLDNSDRVVRWEQVRTEARFDTVMPGITSEEVIDRIGTPSVKNGLARNRGYVWHYRYETPFCKSFVIEFTEEDVVRSAGYRVRSGRTCKYVGPG